MNFTKIPNLNKAVTDLNNPQRGNIVKSDVADPTNMSGQIGGNRSNDENTINFKQFRELGEYSEDDFKIGLEIVWKDKRDKKRNGKITKIIKDEMGEIIRIHVMSEDSEIYKIYPNQIKKISDGEIENWTNDGEMSESRIYLSYNEVIKII